MHGTNPPAKGSKAIISAAEMLRRIFPPGSRIQLASYANVRGDMDFPARHKVITSADEVDAFLAKNDVPGRACYFAVAPITGSSRGKDHIDRIVVAHADIDLHGIVEDEKAVKAALAKLPLKPSIVVMSGHGFHCYWIFDEPLPPEQINSHEDRLKQLCHTLAADVSVAEAARVLRLPGSHNTKGGDNIEVKVIPALSSWKRYAPGEIDTWLERAEPVLTYKPTMTGKTTKTSDEPRNAYQQIGDDTKRGLDIDAALAAMVMHDTRGNGIDDTLTRVIGKLVHNHATLDEVIETVLEPYRLAFERGHEPGETWSQRTAISTIKAKIRYLTKRDARKAERKTADDADKINPDSKLPPLTFINVGAWQDAVIPDREWAVDGVIPQAVPDLFSGEGGTGKSTLSLQAGVAHILGIPWLGMNVRQGPFMYFSAEDDENELHRRLGKILQHNKAEFCDVADHIHLKALDDAVLASVEKSGIVKPTRLYKQLLQAVQDIRPVRLVLDSAADVFAGNEINRSEVRQFIGMMRHLCRAGGTTVSILAHPSLSGISSGSGTSGSTGWHNSARSRSYFSTPKAGRDEEGIDPNIRLLEFKKNNYGPAADSLSLLWTDGFFQVVSGGAAYVIDAGRNKLCDETFIKLLKRFEQQRRYVSANQYAKTFAPFLFAKEDDAKKEGFGKAQFDAAMRRLFVAQRIENIAYGSPSRETTRLVVLK